MEQELEQEIKATEVAPEETETQPEPKQEYDLHIKVPAEMRQRLRDCATLAYKLGEIPKADLVNLMNLFIGWGIAVLHKKWQDHGGYR